MPLNTGKFKYTSPKDVNLLPPTTGIYCFKKSNEFLYIGKAINIKERVKNHIAQSTFKDNIFVPQTQKIGFIATGSEIEALILEANLIKKYQPQYNTVWRDGKSHNFIAITDENFPRVFTTHQKKQNTKYIGPFIDGGALKQTLRVLRRVFPFRTCNKLPKKACLYKDLKLCPAPCQFKVQNEKLKVKKNIRNIIKILQGQKNSVIKNLQKEMLLASKQQNFERAQTLRDQIFALENVFSHSHVLEQEKTNRPQGSVNLQALQKLLGIKNKIKRIEGYDISNIQGQEATGSMVVFENGQPNKNEYRKFKIKITGKPNDTAMLREIISRRLKHKDWPASNASQASSRSDAGWPIPQVMLIDGGKGQLSAGLNIKYQIANIKYKSKISNIKFIALAKRQNELFIEGKDKPILLKTLPQEISNLILQVRDEAHRFAISYHKNLRSKTSLN